MRGEVRSPRLSPVAAGMAVTLACGVALLAAGGAPGSWLIVQSVGAAAALALLAATRVSPMAFWPHLLAVLTLAALVATLLIDPGLDGVHRWLQLGGVRLHPGQMLLPALVALHARDPRGASGAALAVCAALLVVQPDFGTALAIACALVTIALLRRRLVDWMLAAAAGVAAATASTMADPLEPVAMVEHVLTDSWAIAPWAGLLALVGAVAFPGGLWLAARRMRPLATAPLTLAAMWFGLLLASLIGHFPVPLLGYGVSAVIGFGLAARIVCAVPGQVSPSKS